MRSLRNFRAFYVKASSLLESVIAIAIISVCVLVAFSIYINVVNKKRSLGFYNATHMVERITNDSMLSGDYENEELTFEGFNIKKTVEINPDENTVLMSFVITSSKKTYKTYRIIPYEALYED